MTTVVFTVPNISCGHCVATIERVVGELPGVHNVAGEIDSKQVTVAYDPPATPEAIVAAMTEWEYPPADAE
jgi:copper ion binding protein